MDAKCRDIQAASGRINVRFGFPRSGKLTGSGANTTSPGELVFLPYCGLFSLLDFPTGSKFIRLLPFSPFFAAHFSCVCGGADLFLRRIKKVQPTECEQNGKYFIIPNLVKWQDVSEPCKL
jgi:hypothetical protein